MSIIAFTIVTLLLIVGLMTATCIFWAIICGIWQMISDIATAFRNHFKGAKFFVKVRK